MHCTICFRQSIWPQSIFQSLIVVHFFYIHNSVTKIIDMRHFSVNVTPVGLNRSVKEVIVYNVPNLAKCEDISDFVSK